MLYSLEILQPTKVYVKSKYKPAGLQTPISIGLSSKLIRKYGYPMSKSQPRFCKKDSYTLKAILTAKKIKKNELLTGSILAQCNVYLEDETHTRSESSKILGFIKYIPSHKLNRT